MERSFFIFMFFEAWGILGVTISCKHSPILSDDGEMPIDTTDNPTDTTTIDTITMTDPCDPDLVYFDLQILPILNSNCAFSGCHDAATATNGVVLEDYESVMATGDIKAFDIEDSKLYERLVEDDEDKRMPPPPAQRLDQSQVQLIAKWILQGAENLECDPDSGACETEGVSFAEMVKPLIQNNCQGCHSGSVPSGGIDLSTYPGVKTVA